MSVDYIILLISIIIIFTRKREYVFIGVSTLLLSIFFIAGNLAKSKIVTIILLPLFIISIVMFILSLLNALKKQRDKR